MTRIRLVLSLSVSFSRFLEWQPCHFSFHMGNRRIRWHKCVSEKDIKLLPKLYGATLKWSFYISFCLPSAHPSDHKNFSWHCPCPSSDVRPGVNPIIRMDYSSSIVLSSVWLCIIIFHTNTTTHYSCTFIILPFPAMISLLAVAVVFEYISQNCRPKAVLSKFCSNKLVTMCFRKIEKGSSNMKRSFILV